MRLCAPTYILLTDMVGRVTSLYRLVAVAWRQCNEQRCRWWCLCCNKWLCFIALIITAVLITVLLVFVVLIGVAIVTACWGTCILVFIFTFGGNTGRWNLNCFAPDPTPPPPAPLPTVIITRPAAGTPAGYYGPGDLITFEAVAEDVDGSRLTGTAVQWSDTYAGAVDQPLGEGETISVALILRNEDLQAGLVTEHLVSVVATGSDGRMSRPSLRTAYIRPPVIA
jgi:hypothetical protein